MPASRLSALVMALLAAACPAADDFVDPAALKSCGLVKFWQLQLPVAPGEQVRHGYLVDDQLYFGTDQGTVFAVHAYTGAIRWVQPFTSGGYPLSRPAHAGDRTVVATPPEMRQFDRLYGNPISLTDFDFPAGGGVSSDGPRIYVSGFDRRVYAFGPDSPYEVWKVVADGQLTSTPAPWKGFLYFATGRGSVYACEAANKRFLWRTRLGGPIAADLVCDENGVYVPNSDRSLYLLDHVYGGLRWRARFENPLVESPVVTPEYAYQYCEGEGVVALNVATQVDDERVAWKFARGRNLATVTDEHAFVWTIDGAIAALDRKTGKVIAEAGAFGFSMLMPSPGKPAVMLAGADGRVFLAQPVDQPYVTAEEVRAALRQQKPEADQPPPAPPIEDVLAQKDYLGSGGAGKPSGGKSKVSKEFGGGGGQP